MHRGPLTTIVRPRAHSLARPDPYTGGVGYARLACARRVQKISIPKHDGRTYIQTDAK